MINNIDTVTIAEGTEWETTVYDVRRVTQWSMRQNVAHSEPQRIIFWHHSVYDVKSLSLVDQLNWLRNTITHGTYGWPYNFLVWPHESSCDIWYLNDVDHAWPHTYGHNGDTAICAHGNYDEDVPPVHLVDAMWKLSQALCVMWGEVLPIKGHRQVYATACPGKYLFGELVEKLSPTL